MTAPLRLPLTTRMTCSGVRLPHDATMPHADELVVPDTSTACAEVFASRVKTAVSRPPTSVHDCDTIPVLSCPQRTHTNTNAHRRERPTSSCHHPDITSLDTSIALSTTPSSYAQSRCCPESTTGWSTGCLHTTTIGETPVAPWSWTWSRQSPTRPHPPCRKPHQSHNQHDQHRIPRPACQ